MTTTQTTIALPAGRADDAAPLSAGWRCVEEGVRREATTTRPAWTPRVWRRA